MGAQGVSSALLGNVVSFLSSCLAFRPWHHSVLVSLLHGGTLISV